MSDVRTMGHTVIPFIDEAHQGNEEKKKKKKKSEAQIESRHLYQMKKRRKKENLLSHCHLFMFSCHNLESRRNNNCRPPLGYYAFNSFPLLIENH